MNSAYIAAHLSGCCKMEQDCTGAMIESSNCLQNELSRIVEASDNYLSCITTAKTDGVCPFADWCGAILAGGYDTNATTDFGIGSESKLGVMAREATTCEDLDIFGFNACTEVTGCCEPCADKIADIVNAVVDDLLLPSYSTLSNCGGNKTCTDYNTTSPRQLENTVESPSVGSTTIDVENSMNTAVLAGQCSDDLANEILLYNTSSAVSNFFGCLHNSMGKIIAEIDAKELEAARSSSSTVYGAIATALSTILSTLIALV